jgi:hypothetical protein
VKEVWLVEGGEYSDRYVDSVCSSYEQACGVAVMKGLYETGPIEMWEPDDEIPPFKLLHTCLVRQGRDSARPIDVVPQSSPVAVDHAAAPKIAISDTSYNYHWVRAENYPTAEEAEAAALAAYQEVRRT